MGAGWGSREVRGFGLEPSGSVQPQAGSHDRSRTSRHRASNERTDRRVHPPSGEHSGRGAAGDHGEADGELVRSLARAKAHSSVPALAGDEVKEPAL